jgi:hydrogenase nickel incorporation protein HypA/HybF
MHEISLAEEVIRMTEDEAQKHNANVISEIVIEVGSLSGVDADAFESALKLISENSVLDKAEIIIRRINGSGFCLNCSAEFPMTQRMESCPFCRSFPSEIKGGDEFRIRSLTID